MPSKPVKQKPEKIAWRVGEFAEAIGVGRSTVYNLEKAGKIKTRKVGYMKYVLTSPTEFLDSDLPL